MKILKFFKFVYLIFAGFLIFEAVRVWNQPDSQKYLYLGMATVAVFMFFFRRHWGKKMEQRNQK